MKKQHVLAATLGALMLMPALAHADLGSTANNVANVVSDTTNNVVSDVKNTVNPPPAPNISQSDKDFIYKAAEAGMAEIKDAKLAKKTSSNDSVKVFAQTMIDDHKKANDKLKRIAKKLNVSVPTTLDAKMQAEYDMLKNTSTGSFDQTYITAEDKDHNDAVALFQKEADNGDNPMLKSFAAQTLPTLQGHVQMVKQLEAKVPAAASSNQ